jgi:hypothetical protein
MGAFFKKDQKIAAFGSSYRYSYAGAAEGCDLLLLHHAHQSCYPA